MYLIKQNEVLEHAFAPQEQLSAAAIRPARIAIAQERFVRPAFGDRLFQEFVEGAHSVFVDLYLKPALAHYVRYGMIPELAVRVGDRGVYLLESDESERTLSEVRSARRNSQQEQRGNATETTANDRNDSQELTSKVKTVGDSTESKNSSQQEDTTTSDRTTREVNLTESATQRESESTTAVPPETVVTRTEERQQTDELEQTNAKTDKVITDLQSSGDATRSETRDTTQQRNDLRNETGSKTEQRSQSTDTSAEENSDQNANDSRRDVTTRQASERQMRMLAQRALSDGHTLLRAAIRYVEAHRDEFPSYAPQAILPVF